MFLFRQPKVKVVFKIPKNPPPKITMLILNHSISEKFENHFVSITKRKVLIVDDDEFCRGLLFEVLKDKHYCKVVSTAEQALTLIRNENFDLVLTDIRMPKKTGLELLSDIRAINPKMLVIIMTGYAGIDSTVEALRLHAFDYLSKPIDCDTLSDTVERALLQVAIDEENRKFEEDLRAAMSTRTDQVRVLFDAIYRNYRKLLLETAESLEVRGVRSEGHILRKIAFALRLGVESDLSDIDLMILEQGLLMYESNKIGAPDDVLMEEHLFDIEDWKSIFQKGNRNLKLEQDWKIFSLSQRLAYKIGRKEAKKSIENDNENGLNYLCRIAWFSESLCKELEEKWIDPKNLEQNNSLQIIHNETKGLSDPLVLKAFIRIVKIEWLYLFTNPEKYIDEFEERFRQVFYLSVVA